MMVSVLYAILLLTQLSGLGLGTPWLEPDENIQVRSVHPRFKRYASRVPSLEHFEIQKASLYDAAKTLQLEFCNDDHLAGVLCPEQNAAGNETCVSWDEICNGVQVCGVEEFDACLLQTGLDFGAQWSDYCRGDEKNDFCRLKDFRPSRCGSDVTLEAGGAARIKSPNYSNRYTNDAFCFWRITAPKESSIKVEFEDFETEKDYDFVSVSIGLDYLLFDKSNIVLNKVSGKSMPEPAEFKVLSNEIVVTFTSDSYIGKRGFKLTVSIADRDDVQALEPVEHEIDTACGESKVYNLENGENVTIESPNYPLNYNPNSQCDWQFKISPGRRFGIEFIRVNTEYQADTITIGTGKDVGNENSVVNRLEGNGSPPKPMVINDNNAWIRFSSDSAVERSGFKLRVREKTATECGGEFMVPEDGSVLIASPNYPDLAYRLNQDCEWRFHAAPGRKLTMTFLDFRTQKYGDLVSAGFGDEPAFDWSNYVISEHSGDKLPDPPAFDMMKGSAWLSFHSDSFVVERGFKVLVGDSRVHASGVEAVANEEHELYRDCGGEISREDALSEILITSPKNDNGYYPPLSDCTWVVNIPFGGHVGFTWERFLTEKNRDLFTLGNGSDPSMESTIVIDKYSGIQAPDLTDGYFQSIWIRFQSDLLNSFRGWQLRIVPLPYTECGGLLDIPEGGSMAIASPNYPNYYPNGLTCRYTIQSSSSTRIMFTILEFDTSYNDYVTIGEGCSPYDGGSIVLDKQSITKPDNYQLLPRSSVAWMKFSTDDYRNRPGWMINIADIGVPTDSGNRNAGSCELYSTDPTTPAPPEPTKPPVVEEEEEEEEVDHPAIATDDDSPEGVPDWYDDLPEKEEEDDEYSSISEQLTTPTPITKKPIILEPTTEEEISGSGEIEI